MLEYLEAHMHLFVGQPLGSQLSWINLSRGILSSDNLNIFVQYVCKPPMDFLDKNEWSLAHIRDYSWPYILFTRGCISAINAFFICLEKELAVLLYNVLKDRAEAIVYSHFYWQLALQLVHNPAIAELIFGSEPICFLLLPVMWHLGKVLLYKNSEKPL